MAISDDNLGDLAHQIHDFIVQLLLAEPGWDGDRWNADAIAQELADSFIEIYADWHHAKYYDDEYSGMHPNDATLDM